MSPASPAAPSASGMPAALDTPRIAWQPGDDLASIIGRHAQSAPDDAALLQGDGKGDRRVTWSELDRGVGRVAAALAASGVVRGTKVAFLADNSIAYAEALFGVL